MVASDSITAASAAPPFACRSRSKCAVGLGSLRGSVPAQPHPGAPAILSDEFDAGSLKATPYDIKRSSPWLTRTGLQLPNGYDPDAGAFGKPLLAPIKEPSGGSALCWSDHTCPNYTKEGFHQFCRKTIDTTESIVYDCNHRISTYGVNDEGGYRDGVESCPPPFCWRLRRPHHHGLG
jgi:hypothetical protein